MAELALMVEGVAIQRWKLEKAVMTIGRNKENDILISDDSVSGKHASIGIFPNEDFPEQIEVKIKDHDSTNGTFINDKQIKEAVLHDQDSVRIAFTEFKIFVNENDGASTAHIASI